MDVHWIGGGSGGGKSTVARRLARRHGLRLYDTDAVMREHAARSDPATSPQLAAFLGMSMDERWLRPPRTMLETFHWFRGESFGLILDDLAALPPGPPVIAEGFRLLPGLVPRPARAVWLLPSPAFRRAAFDSRGSTWQIAGGTSDPGTALANLLERDALFTERLRAETRRLGLAAIDVEPGLGVDELTARVEDVLGLGGPG
ncbi:(d)CMP kinase [Actinoplanes sp. M2I2]|uniref:(d)CMP kinase n=1 Tax=Actinoplanes sp. M2I2 TaxID=1734444 RepID=UPI0020229B80|nr:(d)CMP kinase [Actinoplanes sp. M2I2]